ncbi:MAG: alternate F1F0 ATPase, F1 subunit alpha [Armatimonadetes bacterium]|nr:alternate F1F0 ATPase, F1 subunit alpha [Gemmatimonadales bacterium]NIO75918.1 alternate F1F0 ATPase, F1 subunit alpha [Armatimonadota bacterium]
MASDDRHLRTVTEDLTKALDRLLDRPLLQLGVQETGTVTYVAKGIARVSGLPTVRSEELISFPGDLPGLAFNLDPNEVGVVLLGESEHIEAGNEVRRTHRLLDVPVGDALLGRVVDALGRPVDGRGPIHTTRRREVEQPAPGIMERQAVSVPLQTGIKVVDALIPIGRGQRELILGDRQTGKTAIAVDTIINQKNYDVLCIYCAIGQRGSAVAKVVADLRDHDALDHTTLMVTTGDDAPGLQYISPYAATSMAEHFMRQGRDVLIVYDDLTRHARAYRELSLLLRRPPGREAYPGDIFYIHSHLLERATNLKENRGGSLTALPIIQTEAQNISAYIPTNLISITDGQVYVSPDLQQKGLLPAVDVGRSVSRVGGKAQLPAYQEVAGDLRLSYSQFEELEAFSRFGTRLDEDTRRTIERGRRIRESLKQPQYAPIPPAEQMAVLLAVTRGLFDDIDVKDIARAEQVVRKAVADRLSDAADKIHHGDHLASEDQQQILDTARQALESFGSD